MESAKRNGWAKRAHMQMHAVAPTEPHIRRDHEASECQVILKGNQVGRYPGDEESWIIKLRYPGLGARYPGDEQSWITSAWQLRLGT